MLLSYKPYGILRDIEDQRLETLVRKGITKEFESDRELENERNQFFVDASRRILCDYRVFAPCDTEDQEKKANEKINLVLVGGCYETHKEIYPILVTYRAVQALYYERLSKELHQRRWSSRWKRFWEDFPRNIRCLCRLMVQWLQAHKWARAIIIVGLAVLIDVVFDGDISLISWIGSIASIIGLFKK